MSSDDLEECTSDAIRRYVDELLDGRPAEEVAQRVAAECGEHTQSRYIGYFVDLCRLESVERGFFPPLDGFWQAIYSRALRAHYRDQEEFWNREEAINNQIRHNTR